MMLDLGLEWEPDKDTWFTPAPIFKALDIRFDMDVCTVPGGVPWIPADVHLSITDDGLSYPWTGTVWCNPPYSDPKPWLYRLADHGDGIALVSADTSTAWWHDHMVTADALLFIRGRLRFVRDTATTSAAFPSVLAAWGTTGVDALNRSGLGWVVNQ